MPVIVLGLKSNAFCQFKALFEKNRNADNIFQGFANFRIFCLKG